MKIILECNDYSDCDNLLDHLRSCLLDSYNVNVLIDSSGRDSNGYFVVIEQVIKDCEQ